MELHASHVAGLNTYKAVKGPCLVHCKYLYIDNFRAWLAMYMQQSELEWLCGPCFMYTSTYLAGCTNAQASDLDLPHAVKSLYSQSHSRDKIFQALSQIFLFLGGPKVISENCACVGEREPGFKATCVSPCLQLLVKTNAIARA